MLLNKIFINLNNYQNWIILLTDYSQNIVSDITVMVWQDSTESKNDESVNTLFLVGVSRFINQTPFFFFFQTLSTVGGVGKICIFVPFTPIRRHFHTLLISNIYNI